MQLASEQALPVSQQQAWDALNNIDILQRSIPGCSALTEVEPQQYDILITASVGPVKAKFKGQLKLLDLNPPKAYRLEFEGQGGAAGHGKGSAAVRLEAISAHRCVLHYEANASVGGKIAQIGQRLVDMAAQKMAAEFFSNFEAQLLALHPEQPALAADEKPVEIRIWNRLWNWFKRIAGGRPAQAPDA